MIELSQIPTLTKAYSLFPYNSVSSDVVDKVQFSNILKQCTTIELSSLTNTRLICPDPLDRQLAVIIEKVLKSMCKSIHSIYHQWSNI